MNRSALSDIIYTIIVIGIAILVLKFVVWAFPVIILLILGYIIYKNIKKTKKEIKRENAVSRDKKTGKKIKVIHEFDDED